jgi:hypothetical protein
MIVLSSLFFVKALFVFPDKSADAISPTPAALLAAKL